MQFQFSDFQDFISMDGHGLFVWLCYALVLSVLVFLAVSVSVREKRFLQRHKRVLRRQQAGEGNETMNEKLVE